MDSGDVLAHPRITTVDAFIKGGSNEEMASRDLQLHPCDTDLENTS